MGWSDTSVQTLKNNNDALFVISVRGGALEA
jgi:hypothetical protein